MGSLSSQSGPCGITFLFFTWPIFGIISSPTQFSRFEPLACGKLLMAPTHRNPWMVGSVTNSICYGRQLKGDCLTCSLLTVQTLLCNMNFKIFLTFACSALSAYAQASLQDPADTDTPPIIDGAVSANYRVVARD